MARQLSSADVTTALGFVPLGGSTQIEALWERLYPGRNYPMSTHPREVQFTMKTSFREDESLDPPLCRSKPKSPGQQLSIHPLSRHSVGH
jgi:hypothetical protein